MEHDRERRRRNEEERIDERRESGQTRCLKEGCLLVETPPQRRRPCHRHGTIGMSHASVHIPFTALFIRHTVSISVPWLSVFGGRVGDNMVPRWPF